MPEGDTIFKLAHRLRGVVLDRRFTSTDFRTPRLAATDLTGRVVTGIETRGKHLFMHLDDGWSLHVHLRMDGEVHLVSPGERGPGPRHEVRAILATDAAQVVMLRVPVLELIASHTIVEVVAHLGPDLLADDFDAAEAARRMLARPELPIGSALLDQAIMAGLGNVYRSELCFLRGLHPFMPVSAVADIGALIALSKKVLRANALRTTRVTTGDTRPGRRLWVYGRGGRPCLRCGTAVSRAIDENERVVYWCARCQPPVGPAPGSRMD